MFACCLDETGNHKVIATLNPREAIGLSETGFYSTTGKRTADVKGLSDITTKIMLPSHEITQY